MFICDCHCDTLTKLDLKKENIYKNNGHLDIQRIMNNGGGIQFVAIFVPGEYRYTGGTKYCLEYIERFYKQLDILTKNRIDYKLIKEKNDLLLFPNNSLGILLSIEEGGAIEGSIDILHAYYRLGVRCMSLTWNYRNEIADGADEGITGGGLTAFGRQVVKEMNRLGMLVDVSHLSDKGFWDVIECSAKPIIASHSNARSLCNVERNLTDEQLKALAQKKGCVGITFVAKFLNTEKGKASIDDIYRQIDYIASLVGDEHVAFGSDFDGTVLPNDISGVQDINRIIDYLIGKNYSSATIEKLCNKNVMRVLSEVL